MIWLLKVFPNPVALENPAVAESKANAIVIEPSANLAKTDCAMEVAVIVSPITSRIRLNAAETPPCSLAKLKKEPAKVSEESVIPVKVLMFLLRALSKSPVTFLARSFSLFCSSRAFVRSFVDSVAARCRLPSSANSSAVPPTCSSSLSCSAKTFSSCSEYSLVPKVKLARASVSS